MNSFYNDLTGKENKEIYLLNKLSNNETFSNEDVVTVLTDLEISDNLKQIIIDRFENIIISLSNNTFIEIADSIDNTKKLIENFKNKLEQFSAEQIISLLRKIEPNDIMQIIHTSRYQQLLKEEISLTNNIDLQVINIMSELYLLRENNQKERVPLYAPQLKCFIDKSIQNNVHSDYLDELCDMFLDLTSRNLEKQEDSEKVFEANLDIMKYKQNFHKTLSKAEISTYIKCLLKDFNVEGTCENISLDYLHEPKIFGYFQADIKSITIYGNYIDNKVTKLTEKAGLANENVINDIKNLWTIRMILHEVGHVVDCQKFEDSMKLSVEEGFDKKLQTDSFCNLYFKNGLLRLASTNEEYQENHSGFIEEYRAEFFSIYEFNNQIEKNFKNIFSDDMLQKNTIMLASMLSTYYTSENADNLNIETPKQKFYNLYNKKKDIIDTSLQTIEYQGKHDLENLRNGDDISIELLKKIKEISEGTTKETNLSKVINEFVIIRQNHNNIDLKEKNSKFQI